MIWIGDTHHVLERLKLKKSISISFING